MAPRPPTYCALLAKNFCTCFPWPRRKLGVKYSILVKYIYNRLEPKRHKLFVDFKQCLYYLASYNFNTVSQCTIISIKNELYFTAIHYVTNTIRKIPIS